MKPKRDLHTRNDVDFLVNTFYERVRSDVMLGPVFNERIQPDAWPVHLERMTQFWSNLLFAIPGYKGSPLLKHIGLPVGAEHFERWLELWESTVNDHFEGDVAMAALTKARNIAEVFQEKLLNNTFQVVPLTDTNHAQRSL